MPDRFKRAIARIMATPVGQSLPGPTPASPRSHGWLRRPELDSSAGEAWEMPDGTIRAVDRPAAEPAKAGRRPRA